jgi:hypothetical protein
MLLFLHLADIPLPKPLPPTEGFLLSPILAFLLTIAIEWPLLAWWSGRGLRRTAAFALLVNGFTWGIANGVLALTPASVPLVELGVVAIEAALLVLFWLWPWRKALPVSLGLNLASWLGGSALFGLLAKSF